MTRIISHRWLPIAGLSLLVSLLIMGFLITTTSATGVLLPWQSPPPNHIAYLVQSDDLTASSLVSPGKLEQTLNAHTVETWAQVQELDAQESLDAIIIHQNALAAIDRAELLDLYGKGVVVAVIDVDAFETAALLDDPCISKNDQGTREYNGTFVIVAYHLILGDQDDVAKVRANKDACGQRQAEGVVGRAMEIIGRTTKVITNESDYNAFANEVTQFINLVKVNKEIFAR